jgi:hypothetical protein
MASNIGSKSVFIYIRYYNYTFTVDLDHPGLKLHGLTTRDYMTFSIALSATFFKPLPPFFPRVVIAFCGWGVLRGAVVPLVGAVVVAGVVVDAFALGAFLSRVAAIDAARFDGRLFSSQS